MLQNKQDHFKSSFSIKVYICVFRGVPGVPVFQSFIFYLLQHVTWNTSSQKPEHLPFQVFRQGLILDCLNRIERRMRHAQDAAHQAQQIGRAHV